MHCYTVALVILIMKFKLHACICECNASPVHALFFLPLFHPPQAMQARGTERTGRIWLLTLSEQQRVH